jgi:hypothetical protein
MKISGIISRLASLGCAFALSSNIAFAAPQPGTAKVTSAKGSVTVNGQPAKVADTFGPGGSIVTGPGSHADVYLGVNGPTVQVNQNTKVTFEQLSYDDAGPEVIVETKLALEQGTVAGYVKKTSSQSTYSVTTPTTTAAIRGTTYLVDADGNVWVWDGCVEVQFRDTSGSLSKFNVCAGQKFDARLGTVVLNDKPSPVPPQVRPPVTPVGPVINLSPSKPREGQAAPVDEGNDENAG